jgi:hypothetical protein
MCRMWEVLITCSISDKEGSYFLNAYRICFLRDFSVRLNIFLALWNYIFYWLEEIELRAKLSSGILVDINHISVE